MGLIDSQKSVRITLFFIGVLICLSFSLILNNSKAYADTCVTKGDVHGYAGLIVNSRWHKYGEPANVYHQSNNTDVRVNTFGHTESPPGNVVRLGSGPEGVVDRRDEVTFDQVNLSYCDYNSAANSAGVSGEAPGDTTNVVLGDGITTTSSPAGDSTTKPWAIDCDASKHGIGNEQLIKISGVGVPSGARAGGTWDDIAPIRMPNGDTTLRTLTYYEPPPDLPDEPTCKLYKHDVYGDSIHRFRVFGRSAALNPTFPSHGSTHTTRDLTNDGVVNISWGAPLPAAIWDSGREDPTHDFERSINLSAFGPVDSGWQVVYERWRAVAGGNYEYYRTIATIDNCFTGDIDGPGVDCSSLSMQASRPTGGNANSVVANTGFALVGSVKNTGGVGIPITVKVIDGGGMAGNQFSTGQLGPGNTSGFYIPMVALNDVSHRIVVVQPQYNGFAIGGNCSIEVDTYQHFTITPVATLDSAQNDNENPTSIRYNYGGTRNEGPDTVSAGSYSIVKVGQTALDPSNIQPGDVVTSLNGPNATNLPYQNQNVATIYNNANIRNLIAPGERFCVRTTIDEATGWLGPHGKVGVSPLSRDSCERMVNKPYVRFYGQDVYAGGRFSGGGAVTSNGIKTNHRSTGAGGIGSGVEYAAYSIGTIEQIPSSNLGFASNSLKAVVGYPAGIGGDHVATDYYAKLPIKATEFGGSLNTPGDEAMKSGSTTIQASQIPLNSSKTLYVDGDVVIAGNITYADWGNNINAIPNFRLVVKGNIYITSNVTRIDGLLVAQPKDGNTGRIHTCININGSPADLSSNGTDVGVCNQQLVINGAVVAQKIIWQRTGWTLSNAINGGREPYNNNRAAEVINTSPDFYLGVPADPADGGGTSGKYDSYQALPPIL